MTKKLLLYGSSYDIIMLYEYATTNDTEGSILKRIIKQSVSVLLVLVLLISLLPNLTLPVSAASYQYNWGKRGTVATELSSKALSWYSRYGVTYDELAALSGSSAITSTPSSALYKELQSLMRSAHSYTNSYKENNSLLAYTDCQNGGGAISSFYSGASIGPSWNGTWNKEHTWPNSKGLGGSDEDDVMMIRPTKTSENSNRGNTAYGKSSGYYHPNQESDKDGNYNSISSGELDLRGDCARICLYIYVRWGNTGKMWGTGGVMESKAVLLEWMAADPVDTWELGRNDSVQSITGTRNVFVDYPELAFELFEADMPAMQTPSGVGSTVKHKVTAQSSNNAQGTVSVDGYTITATPAAGYQVEGYELISGTATVARSGNVFTVTPSSDCTVQINFAPRKQVTVYFDENGLVVSSQTQYSSDPLILPGCVQEPAEGYNFIGWVEQQTEETTTKPGTVYSAGDTYYPTSNATLYALYSYMEPSDDIGYCLVESASQLQIGTSVIIASATSNYALSTTQNESNRGRASVTKDGNALSFDDAAGVAVLTLGAGATNGTYSFYCPENTGYLYCSSTSAVNALNTQSALDANASFAITVKADGTCDVVAQSEGISRNQLKYSSISRWFACYASGQNDIALYVHGTVDMPVYSTQYDDGELRIVKQPQDITAGLNKAEELSVSARGLGLPYQWQYRTSATGNWKNSPATGNDTATLQLSATSTRDGYQYRCVITDELNNTVTTSAATLKVVSMKITKQPISTYLPIGETAKFTVATNSTGLTYQWQYRTSSTGTWKNASAAGNQKKTVNVPVTASRDGYQYRCVVKDQYGNKAISSAAILNAVVLKITTQPSTKYLPTGKTAKFTVKATGTGLSYQWQYRTSSTGSWIASPAAGNATATVSVPVTNGRNGYQYRCMITDTYDNVIYSEAATLKVVRLQITAQPVNKAVVAGKTAAFTVTASGNGLTYQWQYRTSAAGSWKNTSATGNKTATLKIPATASRNGYQYRCVITDQYGNVIRSNTATLTVK